MLRNVKLFVSTLHVQILLIGAIWLGSWDIFNFLCFWSIHTSEKKHFRLIKANLLLSKDHCIWLQENTPNILQSWPSRLPEVGSCGAFVQNCCDCVLVPMSVNQGVKQEATRFNLAPTWNVFKLIIDLDNFDFPSSSDHLMWICQTDHFCVGWWVGLGLFSPYSLHVVWVANIPWNSVGLERAERVMQYMWLQLELLLVVLSKLLRCNPCERKKSF